MGNSAPHAERQLELFILDPQRAESELAPIEIEDQTLEKADKPVGDGFCPPRVQRTRGPRRHAAGSVVIGAHVGRHPTVPSLVNPREQVVVAPPHRELDSPPPHVGAGAGEGELRTRRNAPSIGDRVREERMPEEVRPVRPAEAHLRVALGGAPQQDATGSDERRDVDGGPAHADVEGSAAQPQRRAPADPGHAHAVHAPAEDGGGARSD
eukprot:CAMPEP_0172580806 /NCGR_PEP_ID=MMETSP1067-20121228/139951_1 /TAXON_ID=265564 ORGANISM="Thalassiosira punctigera, Strain Tpunct2005C2" /NCGR_SAMPLE_ID=MMETSP1067 /ASSEMBLY_ACC=CAM_ASM_000444 /LENGTH=209 /DNA_ID=CAMNT_0013373559 /DNA_START=212 /DNA_END=839 /DNA_ORIENTATION=+